MSIDSYRLIRKGTNEHKKFRIDFINKFYKVFFKKKCDIFNRITFAVSCETIFFRYIKIHPNTFRIDNTIPGFSSMENSLDSFIYCLG